MSQRAICVLYIDDNADGRRLIERVLGGMGYSVLVAEDGDHGLQLARQHRPTVILTDMHLPDMDGIAITARVRAAPELAGVRVVVLTASAPHERERALAAGCDAFFEKPLDFDHFMYLVAQWTGE